MKRYHILYFLKKQELSNVFDDKLHTSSNKYHNYRLRKFLVCLLSNRCKIPEISTQVKHYSYQSFSTSLHHI